MKASLGRVSSAMLLRDHLLVVLLIGGLVVASIAVFWSEAPVSAQGQAIARADDDDDDDDDDVLLDDKFDDGVISTNVRGVGSGFFLGLLLGPGSVAEANGAATVSGAAIGKAIVSKDPIPVLPGTILRWDIRAPRPAAGFDGVTVGWGTPDSVGCCTAGVFLEMRGDRVVFDVNQGAAGDPTISRYFTIQFPSKARKAMYTDNTSAVRAEIRLSAAGWRVRVRGKGVDIDKKGRFGGNTGENCTNAAGPFKPTCTTLNDVIQTSGTGGALRALAAAFREGASASFDRVRVNLLDDDDDEDDD